jgi:hypothetical protein
MEDLGSQGTADDGRLCRACVGSVLLLVALEVEIHNGQCIRAVDRDPAVSSPRSEARGRIPWTGNDRCAHYPLEQPEQDRREAGGCGS